MADRSMHCVMLNNQSFLASVAGDKSRDLQANEGVCSRGRGGKVGRERGFSGVGRKEVPKGYHSNKCFVGGSS